MHNTNSKKIFLYIYHHAKQFKMSLFTACMLSVIWAIDLSIRPYVFKIILNRIAENSNQAVFSYIGLPSLIYLCMSLILVSACRCYDYFVDINMLPQLRQEIFKSSFKILLNKSYIYYHLNFSGSLSNKINDLTYSIPKIIMMIIDSFFSFILALFIAIFVLWQVNMIFALIMIVWSVLFLTISLTYSQQLCTLAALWCEQVAIITGKIVDSLSNILSIKLFAGNTQETRLLTYDLEKAVKADRALSWSYFWVWFYYGYSFVLVEGINFYFLLKGREAGWITVGDFIIVLTINLSILDTLRVVTKDLSEFLKLFGRISQALHTLESIPDIQDQENAMIMAVVEGEIKFHNVAFSYHPHNVFDFKTLTIPAGQKVGLVGYSGGGKSTFINLILRLYDVSTGFITIDGQNITTVTQDSLHEQIAVIPQDPSLFNRTLIENIRYGKINASDEEVMAAAHLAQIDKFIDQLPAGYNTNVGERGIKLSGGQRQRVAIARAILKNAPILILDEATSQLDSITENDIQNSLWSLMQNKTTLVIAHRLSTLLNMDRLLVFYQGSIVEDGTHQELLAKNGYYTKLWLAQVGGFLLDHDDNECLFDTSNDEH